MAPHRQLQLLEVLVVVAIVATIALKIIPIFTHRPFSQRPSTFGILFAIAWLVWRILSSRKSR